MGLAHKCRTALPHLSHLYPEDLSPEVKDAGLDLINWYEIKKRVFK